MNGTHRKIQLVERGGRRYAAKALHSGLEAELLASLSHPAIPAFLEVSGSAEGPVLIMEHMAGRPLSQYPAPRSQLWALSLGIRLAEALAYLHRQGIVHRDVKPDNIICRPGGAVALVDLGSARKTGDPEQSPATVGYAAPEQYPVKGRPPIPVDGRADIYALGVVLHELVTGCVPPPAGKRPRPIRRIDPDLSAELEQIICRCTSAAREDRYPTMEALLADLRGCSQRLKRAQALAVCRCCILAGLGLSAAAALRLMNNWQEV